MEYTASKQAPPTAQQQHWPVTQQFLLQTADNFNYHLTHQPEQNFNQLNILLIFLPVNYSSKMFSHLLTG